MPKTVYPGAFNSDDIADPPVIDPADLCVVEPFTDTTVHPNLALGGVVLTPHTPRHPKAPKPASPVATAPTAPAA